MWRPLHCSCILVSSVARKEKGDTCVDVGGGWPPTLGQWTQGQRCILHLIAPATSASLSPRNSCHALCAHPPSLCVCRSLIAHSSSIRQVQAAVLELAATGHPSQLCARRIFGEAVSFPNAPAYNRGCYSARALAGATPGPPVHVQDLLSSCRHSGDVEMGPEDLLDLQQVPEPVE